MSMREKYQSLALSDLKAIAKARGIKNTSTMKKADVIEAMLALDEQEGAGKGTAETESAAVKKEEETAAPVKEEKKTETQETPVVAEGRGNYRTQNNYNQNRMQDRRQVRKFTPNQSENRTTAPQEENRQQAENRESVEPKVQPAVSVQEGSDGQNAQPVRQTPFVAFTADDKFPAELDSGIAARGILEVMPDGYGFIRSANYLPGDNDVYVAPSQIRRFGLKTGDILVGNTRVKTQNEKFSALLYVKSINGYTPEEASKRYNFEDMTPVFPDDRIKLEQSRSSVAMRIMDLMSPVGKGQRGMIVSPPKAGKTTLLKQVAQSVKNSYPDIHLIILLIDERPEEVTDFREAIEGPNVEVIYSTFDELPEHHKRVSEMVIERAKRLVEHKKDVMILLDSITRLTRAYNLVIPPSGRTLSGGLDPAALHMPKRFFGAARNMREGGSLKLTRLHCPSLENTINFAVLENMR